MTLKDSKLTRRILGISAQSFQARAARRGSSQRIWQGILSVLLLLILVVLAPSQAGCTTHTDEQVLAKSVVSYSFRSAPMAPAFLSEYEVTVRPDRSVRLWYRYGPGRPADGVTRNFRISAGQRHTLIRVLAKADVLGNQWTPGDPPTGADQESLSIWEASGKTVLIRSILQQEPMSRFLAVATAMRATVPRAAWLKKEREGEAYQKKQH